jgi:hypothetical protein
MKRLGNGRLAALVLGMTLVAATPAAPGDESPAAGDGRKPAAAPAEESRNRAADAHAEAVSKAAEAVVSATKLELDIRLISHTSVQVANDLH